VAVAPGPFEVVDLSQPLTPDMAGWRGTQRAAVTQQELTDIDHCVAGGRISATSIAMPAHAGTHVDAARHFFPDGPAIDDYDVQRFVCRGVAVDVRRDEPRELTLDELLAADPGIRAGDAVLLWFGWAERYTGVDYHRHPWLSGEVAAHLARLGVNLVGADVPTPDKPPHLREKPFPYVVHATLLERDVLIVENLGPGLAQVIGRPFLFVMPVFRIPGADASPVVPLALLSAAETA
jgi:kynurenine formamidase